MNGGFVAWLLVIGLATLLFGAPAWAAIGFGLVGGLVGNIDRRMITEAQRRTGIES
jgi:hypothetical protein